VVVVIFMRRRIEETSARLGHQLAPIRYKFPDLGGDRLDVWQSLVRDGYAGYAPAVMLDIRADSPEQDAEPT
jgi:hypothetical protein